MAFNINITKKENVDFKELNSFCDILDRYYVTVFPITRNRYHKEEGIGLSVNMSDDYSEFWESFEPFLINLLNKKYIITELYSGKRIDKGNIIELKELLG